MFAFIQTLLNITLINALQLREALKWVSGLEYNWIFISIIMYHVLIIMDEGFNYCISVCCGFPCGKLRVPSTGKTSKYRGRILGEGGNVSGPG